MFPTPSDSDPPIVSVGGKVICPGPDMARKRQMKSHHHPYNLDKQVHDLRLNIKTVREGSALDLNMLMSIQQCDLLHRHSYDVFEEDNQDRLSHIYH
jgi:hypothetical protein